MAAFPIAQETLMRLGLVPKAWHDDVAEFYCLTPSVTLLQSLEFSLTRRVRLEVCSEQDLLVYQRQFMNFEFDFSEGEFDVNDLAKSESEDIDTRVSEDPVVQMLNNLVNSSIEKKASDIHFETHAHGGAVRVRINGVMEDFIPSISTERYLKLVSRIKVLSNLDIAERRIAQDGRFSHLFFNQEVDCRVSIIPTQYGENLVVRLLGVQFNSMDQSLLNLSTLELDKTQEQLIKTAIHRPHGIIVLSGPTGSGKTTTLYSSVAELSGQQKKIITIEDPIEYELDGVMQIAVNNTKGVTFSSGLRSILRHDPDVILVGEIRDEETAKMAIQSALTGHLVLTTIHANGANDVITRFLQMGVDRLDLLSSLNCIVNQRLIRLSCEHCQALEHLKTDCKVCSGTGYHRRKVLSETILVDEPLAKKWLTVEHIEEVLADVNIHMTSSLRDEAFELLKAGLTTEEEVDRVTYS